MKIGITLIVDKNTNIFSNGILQNIILMQELLEKCKGVERCYLINIKDLTKEDYVGSFWSKYSDILLTRAEAAEICDLHIVCHGFYSAAECKNLRDKGKKLIKHVMGASLAIFNESIVFSNKLNGAGVFGKISYDAVWVSPHFYDRDKHFIKVSHDCPIYVGPYIWDPRFIEEHANLIGFEGYSPSGTLAKRLSTAEPNINLVKTCTIPITIAELLERQNPEILKFLAVFCGDKIKDNKDMIDWAVNLDINQKKKCSFEYRYPLVKILSKYTDIVLCHQNQCELNYLYLDAAWLGYPVVHNSPMMKELGWYYPDNDADIAIEHIKYIANNFDTLHHPDSIYRDRSRNFASQYLIDNNIQGYEELLQKLFSI